MKTLLWLDDIRDPNTNDWITKYSPIGTEVEVVWVKNYDEFTDWINENGLPDAICFDHDLSDFQAFYFGFPEHFEDLSDEQREELWETEKTGYDCAKWLTNYCTENQEDLPMYVSHSSNSVGRKNIQEHLTNFLLKGLDNSE